MRKAWKGALLGGGGLVGLLVAAEAVAGDFADERGVIAYNGDRITGVISEADDVDSFAFGLGERDVLTLTLKAAKKSGFLPALRVFRPDGSEADPGLLLTGAGGPNLALKKFAPAAGESGLWRFEVSGTSGTTGGYTITLKRKEPKKVVLKGEALPAGQQRIFSFSLPSRGIAVEQAQVFVSAGSTEFDPVVELLGPDGSTIATSDDGDRDDRRVALEGTHPLDPGDFTTYDSVTRHGMGLRFTSTFSVDATVNVTITLAPSVPAPKGRKITLLPEVRLTVDSGCVNGSDGDCDCRQGTTTDVHASGFLPEALAGGANNRTFFLVVSSFEPDGDGTFDVVVDTGTVEDVPTGTTGRAGLTLRITPDEFAPYGPRVVRFAPDAIVGEVFEFATRVRVVAPDPVVSSVAIVGTPGPVIVRQGATFEVELTGTGFRDGCSVMVSGTGLNLGTPTVMSTTVVRFTVTLTDTAAVGLREITYTQPLEGGGAETTATTMVDVRYPIPMITSLTPATIVQGESPSIRVRGTGLRVNGSHLFGSGVTVMGTTFTDSTDVTVMVSVGAQAAVGQRNFSYRQNDDGGGDTAMVSNGITIHSPTPTLTAVSPTVVRQGESSVASFATGTNFRSGGSLTVSGSGVSVSGLTFTSDTRLDFNWDTLSAAEVGQRDVTFTHAAAGGGGSVTLSNALRVDYPTPSISTVSPTELEVDTTGNAVTVTGAGFRADGTFSFSGSGVTVTGASFTNETSVTLTVSVAAGATLGLRDLTFTHHASGGGASVTKTNALEVKPVGPVLTASDPDDWIPGSVRFRVALTGVNFNSGTVVSLSGSGITVHSTTFVSATRLDVVVTVDSDAALGDRDMTITPGSGGGPAKTFTAAVHVAAAAPVVASFSAATVAQGTSALAVTVGGSGFLAGDSLAASGSGVSFGSVTIASGEKITATVSVTGGAATGLRDLTVTHASSKGGKSGTRKDATKVIGATPTVTAVAPAAGGRTGSGGATREVPVTVTGTNFMSGATLSVSKSAGSGLSVVSNTTVVVSDTSLTARLSVTGTATTGTWDLLVTNPQSLGNSGTSGNGLFDVKSESTLAVNRVIDASGSAFGGERVTIQGSGFVAGATADFGTVTAAGTQVLDANTIVTTVPRPASSSATAATTVNVKVTNPSTSSATLNNGYAYAADDTSLTVTSIFPAQGATGVPKNLVSAVVRLSSVADTATGTYGTTQGTNCRWFESGGFLVTSALRGFGPGNRLLVFSRTGGGNLPINSAGTYVLEIPSALKTPGGNAFRPTRVSSLTFDQWTFTLHSTNTDTTAPTLSSIAPSNTSTGVAQNTAVRLVFSEEIDPLTLTLTNITFKQSGTTIPADLALADDLKTVTITPLGTLAASTTYTTSVTGAVTDLFGNAFSSTSYTFTTGSGTDSAAPVIDAVVIEEVPSSMDGSGNNFVDSGGTGGNAFDLYLPKDGWLVEVQYSDAGGGIDETTFSAKASVAVAGNSANAELASNFSVTPTRASWRIPSSGFATGDNATFTFGIKDKSANAATSAVVTVDVVDRDATATNGGDHDPFDTRQTWVIRSDLDAYTATFSTATGPNRQGATTTVASNGIPDLDEALRLVGLATGSMTTDAANTVNGNETGTNDILKRLFLERLRALLRRRFGISESGTYGADSANVEFLLKGEQGSLASLPAYSTANSFNSAKAFSEMSLGGTVGADGSAFSASGTLGQAWYDARNGRQEANLNFGVGGSTTGIYLLGMLKLQVNDSTTASIFGSRVSAKLVSIHGGTPAGEGSLDDDVLAGTFDRTSGSNTGAQNTRYDGIMDAIELVALYASSVTAHEVGHSTGLVEDGAPKTGLFGAAHYTNAFTEATSGSPNTSHHLDFLGNDIMAASTSFTSGVATGSDFKRFSPLDIAYLLGRLVYDEGK